MTVPQDPIDRPSVSEVSTPRFLEFRRLSTGETSRRVEVTGRGEREIERIMGGMLINIGDDWRVHDTAWDTDDAALAEGE